MEAYSGQDEFHPTYIVRNNIVYIKTQRAAELLGYSLNAFEVAISRAKKPNATIADVECWREIIAASIRWNDTTWYPQQMVYDFRQLLWEQEDFCFRITIAISEIIEQNLISIKQLAELLGMHHATIYAYHLGESTPRFNDALKIYKILKGVQYGVLQVPTSK